MQAAVVPAFGKSLVIEESRDPVPGAGQVRARVAAPGLCHGVIGSGVGIRQNPDEVFLPHAAGHTRVVSPSRPLASVDESFQDVSHGPLDARSVYPFPDGR
jgi:hypothetical protein